MKLNADIAIVYFNPKAISHKKLTPISSADVLSAFGRNDLLVISDSEELEKYIKSLIWDNQNLLMMSSGNFNGIALDTLIQ